MFLERFEVVVEGDDAVVDVSGLRLIGATNLEGYS
jgi:hypothetical protein